MNEGTAIEIAKWKMKELGIGEDSYILRYRHFRLDPTEKIEIKAIGQHYFFIYPYYNILVSSRTGVYDMEDDGVNEMQHSHSGLITIENKSNIRLDAKFIQAIPITESTGSENEISNIKTD